MAYRVAFRDDAWQGTQQVMTQILGSITQLVVTLARSATGRPEVVGARIEQSYITRREGRKWRVVERLPVQNIELISN
jgi:hypothetical protein